MHQLALDCAAREHQDDDEGVRVHIDEVEALDGSRRAACQRERGVVGHLGGEPAHVGDRGVQLPELLLQAAVHVLRLLEGELLLLHQLVDIHTVTHRGGHAAGGGVRLLQIAHRDQLRKLVADRGGGAVQRAALSDGFAADRLGGADIFVHDRGQNLLFSLAQ